MGNGGVDLQFDCACVNIEPLGSGEIHVVVDNVGVNDVADTIISELGADDIVSSFNDTDALLNEIGLEACKKYFDLEEID